MDAHRVQYGKYPKPSNYEIWFMKQGVFCNHIIGIYRQGFFIWPYQKSFQNIRKNEMQIWSRTPVYEMQIWNIGLSIWNAETPEQGHAEPQRPKVILISGASIA